MTAGERLPTAFALPPLWSWQDFVDAARAPDTIGAGEGRHAVGDWAGATWEEALRLARDGWTREVPHADVSVAALRERAGEEVATTRLVPVWDVTGSEVDVGAYLAGVPECMVDAAPQLISTRGRVVTFFVPAAYSNNTSHAAIRNRGLALAALCSAIIGAGHSVEVWSGYCAHLGERRCSAAARVISAAEPFDVGRLIFVMAHPAFLRRLWVAVWDSAPAPWSALMNSLAYGTGPYTCHPDDLPDGVREREPYVFPFLSPQEPQWRTFEAAMAWCEEMFRDLGLVRGAAAARR